MKKYSFKPHGETGTLSENDLKRYFSTLGLAVFVFTVASQLSVFAAINIIYAISEELYSNAIVQHLITLLVNYGIALPLMICVLKVLPKDVGGPDKMGGGAFFATLCVSFAFMSVGNTLGNYIAAGLSALLDREILNPVESMTSGTSVWINLVFVAILAPVLEELVFRKILCDRILPLGEGYAVCVSALVFGLAHGNFYQFPYAFLLGLVFGFVYVRTGKIRYSMIYHFIINFFGGVFVPWVYQKVSPVLTEEVLTQLESIAGSGDADALNAFYAETVAPYAPYLFMYSGYILAFNALAIAGAIILMRKMFKFKFRDGILPLPKKGRLAAFFCNWGVAVAIAAYAGVFLLSFL